MFDFHRDFNERLDKFEIGQALGARGLIGGLPGLGGKAIQEGFETFLGEPAPAGAFGEAAHIQADDHAIAGD